jgi:hypothetical protein
LGAPHGRIVDAEGRFTIPVIPGTGILTFDADEHRKYSRAQGADSIKDSAETPLDDRIYDTEPFMLHPENTNALQRVDVPVGASSAEVTFQIHSGLEVVGKVIDDDGNPVTGVIASGEGGFGDGWYPLEDASFHVRAFYPKSPRKIGFYHAERQLAASLQLDDVPPEPLTVTLRPSGGVRGRLLDENGLALGHYMLSGDGVPDQWHSNNRQPLATDEEGRFEIRGLIPGREYTVTGRSKEGPGGTVTIGTVFKAITIGSAQIHDVGDVKLKPRMNGE